MNFPPFGTCVDECSSCVCSTASARLRCQAQVRCSGCGCSPQGKSSDRGTASLIWELSIPSSPAVFLFPRSLRRDNLGPAAAPGFDAPAQGATRSRHGLSWRPWPRLCSHACASCCLAAQHSPCKPSCWRSQLLQTRSGALRWRTIHQADGLTQPRRDADLQGTDGQRIHCPTGANSSPFLCEAASKT